MEKSWVVIHDKIKERQNHCQLKARTVNSNLFTRTKNFVCLAVNSGCARAHMDLACTSVKTDCRSSWKWDNLEHVSLPDARDINHFTSCLCPSNHIQGGKMQWNRVSTKLALFSIVCKGQRPIDFPDFSVFPSICWLSYVHGPTHHSLSR